MSEPDRLVTLPELEEIYPINSETWRKWILAGLVRGYQPGGFKSKWLVSLSEAHRFIHRPIVESRS